MGISLWRQLQSSCRPSPPLPLWPSPLLSTTLPPSSTPLPATLPPTSPSLPHTPTNTLSLTTTLAQLSARVSPTMAPVPCPDLTPSTSLTAGSRPSPTTPTP